MNITCIIVSAECDGYGSSDGGDAIVQTKVCEKMEDTAKALAKSLAFDWMAMDALLKDRDFVNALNQRGFRNIEKLKNLAEKTVGEKRFYIYDFTQPYASVVELVNLDDPSSYDITRLANDKVLLFESLDKGATFAKASPQAHKLFVEELKKKAKRAKAAAKAAATKAQKKMQARLEAARKLLEAEGKKV